MTTTTTTTTTTTNIEEEEEMALAEEKEAKRQLVLTTVIHYCTSDSEFIGLSQIGKVLEEEEKNVDEDDNLLVECKFIAGGKTNYSYKLFLTNDPSKALFAKIAFDFALWNPDRSVFYDVKRMDNEFELMKRCSVLMKDTDTGFTPIAQPYHLIDIDEHSKLIITEWADGDEQWANQFIDGIVDKRVLPKLAKAIATLNTIEDVDPMFNDNVRPCMVSMFPQFKVIFEKTINSYNNDDSKLQATIAVANPHHHDKSIQLEASMAEIGQTIQGQCHGHDYYDTTTAADIDIADPYDKSIQLAASMEIGQDEFNNMMDKMNDEFMNDRRCYIHNDTHCFNILVEKKPSISTLEQFGPSGNTYICDWEMTVAGPQGADPGKVICYPIACAICHAMNGNKKEAYHILDCITEFWDHYESYIIEMKMKMKNKNKDAAVAEKADDDDDDAFMIDLYRLTLGWASFMVYTVFYQLNIFHDTMPVQDLSLEHNSRAKGSYASVGLKLMKFAYGSDRPTNLSLEESKEFFTTLMTNEIEELLAIAADAASKRPRGGNRRRSSLLRMTGRRVSVSEEIIAEVHRRMSQPEIDKLLVSKTSGWNRKGL